ncbi:hypothetical protein GCM10010994_45800 [Chelatococcus reniformis]|uniref:Uncharacterized protein n=1 Tax=Chelatococcus reniformis TaxID=1494448 RepID=A0A916UR38_9HYPH|nr:hypothetical protein GCM10010994_45800 [Chelatococcus reniformis]
MGRPGKSTKSVPPQMLQRGVMVCVIAREARPGRSEKDERSGGASLAPSRGGRKRRVATTIWSGALVAG